MGIGQMPFTRRCHETRVARKFDRLILVFVTSLCASTGMSRFTPTCVYSLVRYHTQVLDQRAVPESLFPRFIVRQPYFGRYWDRDHPRFSGN